MLSVCVEKQLRDFLLEVSLSVAKGKTLVLIGENGAGKSTVLNLISGLLPPDSGEVILKGRVLYSQADQIDVAAEYRNIGHLFQSYALFPHLSVFDNVAFGLRCRKMPKMELASRVRGYLEEMNLAGLSGERVGNLSGGQRQRVALARALILEPDLLLLDEPLAALDVKSQATMRRELRESISLAGIPAIVVTHNFEEVLALADRVAVMNQGRIVQTGPPDEVFHRPNCEFIAHFTGIENIFRGVCSKDSGISTITIGSRSIITASNSCKEGTEVYATIRPEDVLISRTPVTSSARNSLPGRITGIANNGLFVKLTVDAGMRIVSVLTRQGFEEMGLSVGDQVHLTFKAAAVHVF